MIQKRPYEFMVSYTPQTQWIEKGGIKLWLNVEIRAFLAAAALRA